MKYLANYSLYLALILILAAPANAQHNSVKLSLDDIYRKGSYPTRFYRSVRWMEDH